MNREGSIQEPSFVFVKNKAHICANNNEEKPRFVDYPMPDQVKLYFSNASLHLRLKEGIGIYEAIRKRPFFYHFNLLHRNEVEK